MGTRRTRIVVAALVCAVLAGAAVGFASQMTAVSVVDPRPSVPPPSPTASAQPSETATPSPTATATPDDGNTVWLYTIAEGDSLSGIAIRFGTTTEELLALNPEYEDNENLVEDGAQVIVPCTPIAEAEDRC